MNIDIIKEIKVLLKTTRFLFKKNAHHSKVQSGEKFRESYKKHFDEFFINSILGVLKICHVVYGGKKVWEPLL